LNILGVEARKEEFSTLPGTTYSCQFSNGNSAHFNIHRPRSSRGENSPQFNFSCIDNTNTPPQSFSRTLALGRHDVTLFLKEAFPLLSQGKDPISTLQEKVETQNMSVRLKLDAIADELTAIAESPGALLEPYCEAIRKFSRCPQAELVTTLDEESLSTTEIAEISEQLLQCLSDYCAKMAEALSDPALVKQHLSQRKFPLQKSIPADELIESDIFGFNALASGNMAVHQAEVHLLTEHFWPEPDLDKFVRSLRNLSL